MWRHVFLALTLTASACAPASDAPLPSTASGAWLEFDGSWNAAGTRRIIPLGAERTGSLVHLRGTMLLSGPGRPGTGFHSEVIGMNDSATGFVGRSVWTDEHGDQVYSELAGEGTAAKNRMKGTILGGTGRYAGATGEFEFSWQFVLEAEDGSIQGRAVELKGRVRRGSGTGDERK